MFESGLLVDDILRLNYMNIGYLGLGAGVLYRYGEYSNEKVEDNLAIKFSMTFRTR